MTISEDKMINRRQFALRAASTLGALAAIPAVFSDQLAAASKLENWIDLDLERLGAGASPELLAKNERFWARVRTSYVLNPSVINLDHGWTNPTPRAAVDELVHGARRLEALPAEELANIFFGEGNLKLHTAFAHALGVPLTEIALVRNATEALDTVLLGFPLKDGDEIVCSAHDYFAMLDALDQRRARDGVVLRMIRPPIPAPSLNALAELYEAAITPRTRLVLVTHVSNLTGQLYPIQRICAAAHKVGAEVVLDGAQALGLHVESISDLGCDYYGASGHKWLGTPVGIGILWMRPEHVKKIWPMVPPPPISPEVPAMVRFEWIGTSPDYILPAAFPALDLHRSLGPAKKAARLTYLTSYLRKRLQADLPDARFYAGTDAGMSIGITTFELPGVSSDDLQKRLRERYHILTQSMAGNERTPEIRGLRVTPNVFTSLAELDRLVAAVKAIVR